jgi:hypothetical protein
VARRRRRRRRRRVLLAAFTVTLLAGAAAGWVWWTGAIGGLPARPHCTATANGNTAELDPEQAGNAATIAAIAVRRGLPARAATIGIATAMQESKLYNVAGGDRDSIGLFQQRPSQGWGTAAQVHDPVYASNAFYAALVKVADYQTLSITAVAQKVQRSAFPTAYAFHEADARIWASALSGYSTAALTCVLSAPSGAGSGQQDGNGLSARAQAVLTAASAETGRTGQALTGTGGTALQFTPAASDTTRMAWALAQWAVARAQTLDVTAVELDGMQWRRADGAQGWTRLGTGTGTGTVVVRTD